MCNRRVGWVQVFMKTPLFFLHVDLGINFQMLGLVPLWWMLVLKNVIWCPHSNGWSGQTSKQTWSLRRMVAEFVSLYVSSFPSFCNLLAVSKGVKLLSYVPSCFIWKVCGQDCVLETIGTQRASIMLSEISHAQRLLVATPSSSQSSELPGSETRLLEVGVLFDQGSDGEKSPENGCRQQLHSCANVLNSVELFI